MIAIIRDPPLDEADGIIEELSKHTEVEVIMRDELSYPMEIKSSTILRWDSIEQRPLKNIVQYLEILEMEKKIINSTRVIRIGQNKGLMGHLFEKKKVPTPRFAVVDSLSQAIRHSLRIGFPVVAKPVEGTGGKNIHKFESREELELKFPSLLSREGAWIIQEYIEKPGRDIRVVVVGGRASIAYYRIGKSWITNVHSGGTRKEFDGDKEVLSLAEEAANAIGEGIFGIDIMEGRDSYYVIEANPKPGVPLSLPSLAKKMSKDIASYVLENLE